MSTESEEIFPPDDPFHTFHAKDGFHVVRVEVGPVLQISCVAYSGGKQANLFEPGNPKASTADILQLFDPTPAQRGAAIRLHNVLDAVARYFNTGGDWREFDNALKEMQFIARGGIAFRGYHLMDSYITDEGLHQHIFVKNDTDQAVVWEQPDYNASGGLVGGWIDSKTLEEIRAEEEEGDDDAPRRVRGQEGQEEEGEEEARLPDPLPLPPHHGDEGPD